MSEIDALIENANLDDMLEFETQIFLDVVHNDGLVVAAKCVIAFSSKLSVFTAIFTGVYC